MKRKISRTLLLGCFLGMVFVAAGCNNGGSQDNKSKKQIQEKDGKEQSGEKSNIVEAEYDANLQVILGEGLIYEVLEENTPSMKVASYHDVALEEITIPDTVVYEEKEYHVTEIAESAFESNALLRTVTLPKGMKKIGNSAFYSCPELTEVIFSDTIVEIGESSFAECYKLSQVPLPPSLESIGAEAYSNCAALQKVKIPAKTKNIDRAVFYGCEKLTECQFEEGIVQISNEMFTNCYALCNVDIPDSVTVVGEEAFWGCSSLTEISLPEQVAMIGNRAFYSTGIVDLRLPANLSGITLELLEGMDELKKITVPESQKDNYEKLFQNYDLEIAAY